VKIFRTDDEEKLMAA